MTGDQDHHYVPIFFQKACDLELVANEGSREMRDLDRDYCAATGLRDRRHYKIFYSHIHPFPLLALGQNQGVKRMVQI